MTQQTSLAEGYPWSLVEEKAAILETRQKLLAHLNRYGIIEPKLRVYRLRSHRPHRLGHYTSLSQFHRMGPRINVDPGNIWRYLAEDDNADRQTLTAQVEATVFHEYGHVIAECIRICRQFNEPLKLRAWQPQFDSDEEEFAEDFARHLADSHSQAEFWERFLPSYGKATAKRFYA